MDTLPPDDLLTVVLPVRDRAAFTRRWLAYHEGIRFPFKVLIADGGSSNEIASLVADPGLFPGLTLEYQRYPYDATYSDFYAKLDLAIAGVTTPFVAMIDNDDFYVTEGLRKSVAFLAARPDYVSCGGQCVYFWLRPDAAGEDLVYSTRVDWKAVSDASSPPADNGRQRVFNQSFGWAFPLYYHVYRTAQLRERWAVVRENDPHDLFMAEQTLEYLTAIAGRSMQLDSIFMARQRNAPGSSGCAHQAKEGDWFDRLLVTHWSNDFGKFLGATAAALAREDGIAPDEARRWIKRCYRIALAPDLLTTLLETEGVTASSVLGTLAVRRLVALPATNIFRRLAWHVFRSLRWISLHSLYGYELRTRGVPHVSRDFESIRDFLGRRPALRGEAPPLIEAQAAPAVER